MSADSKLVVGDSKKYDVRPKKVLCGEDYEDVSWISETQQLFCGFFSNALVSVNFKDSHLHRGTPANATLQP